MDLNKKEINFFDSYGSSRRVPPEIDCFAERLIKSGKKCGLELKYSQNKSQFQKKNSECGVYCLYFLMRCLDGVDFQEFTNNPVSDDEINKFRIHKGWLSLFRPDRVPVGL